MQGVCPEYDAARARIQQLQRDLEGVVAEEQRALAGRGEAPGVTRKVRLVQLGEEALLEVGLPVTSEQRSSK
jgi:hypothetical protein